MALRIFEHRGVETSVRGRVQPKLIFVILAKNCLRVQIAFTMTSLFRDFH